MTAEQVARYWAKVKKGPGCWEWTAFRDGAGYGRMRLGPTHKRGHQIAWFLKHGEWVPMLRHTCDNPPCCNPDHLLTGTMADNNRDMDERGRRVVGSRYYCAKLTEDKVRTMRHLRERLRWRYQDLADAYGVSMSSVQGIIQRRTWRRVR